MKIIINTILILLVFGRVYSQVNPQNFPPVKRPDLLISSGNSPVESSSYSPVAVGIAAFLYLVNPILLYEDKKIYAGITKEISVGFGKFGEHRFAFEYSFIFTGNITHHTRLSYKYDLLLGKNIEPSHFLQGMGVISIGAGYFTNFSKQGAFPEMTFGYALRNHKLLIYPHIKVRHTYMFSKNDSGISDISFGLMLGFANPFTDVNIKRDY